MKGSGDFPVLCGLVQATGEPRLLHLRACSRCEFTHASLARRSHRLSLSSTFVSDTGISIIVATKRGNRGCDESVSRISETRRATDRRRCARAGAHRPEQGAVPFAFVARRRMRFGRRPMTRAASWTSSRRPGPAIRFSFSGRNTISRGRGVFPAAPGDSGWGRAIGRTARPTPSWPTRRLRPGRAKLPAKSGCTNGCTASVTILPARGHDMPARDADGAEVHGYVRSARAGWTDYYRDLMSGNVEEDGRKLGIPLAAAGRAR